MVGVYAFRREYVYIYCHVHIGSGGPVCLGHTLFGSSMYSFIYICPCMNR